MSQGAQIEAWRLRSSLGAQTEAWGGSDRAWGLRLKPGSSAGARGLKLKPGGSDEFRHMCYAWACFCFLVCIRNESKRNTCVKIRVQHKVAFASLCRTRFLTHVLRFAFVSLLEYFGKLFPLAFVSLVVSETTASVTHVSKLRHRERLFCCFAVPKF